MLRKSGFKEDAIWEGDEKIFPVLYQFRDALRATAMNSVVLLIQFPPGFKYFEPVSSKSYKVNPHQQIQQVSIILNFDFIYLFLNFYFN